MSSNESFAYAVDIVMCIDVTGSMHPVIDAVKENAIRFQSNIERKFADKDKRVEQLRVRVIAFRDFGADSEQALEASEFFVLPDDTVEFERFVRGLTHGGGGDAPESGLDALAYALQSDWVRTLDRRRHIVVMFTDAPSHPLAHASHHPEYPTGIATNLDDLFDEWNGDGQTGGMEPSTKRLLLFAPDGDPWSSLGTHLEYAIHYPSQAGQGIADHDFDSILELIANSV